MSDSISDLDNLEPAGKEDTIVYMPYCLKDKRSLLPLAISLFKKGGVEGERQIEASENVPFAATWYVSMLPSELTFCQLIFNSNADLSYEMEISNADLVKYLTQLIETFQQSQFVDFSEEFYRKLLKR